MNTAILLAAHGSRRAASRTALDGMVARVNQAWPGIPCAVAFTSAHVLKIMHDQGEMADDVATALDKLHDAGHRRVAIQSLHIIPGREFNDLHVLANRLMVKDERFERIEVGMPLLADDEDLELAADALMTLIPKDRAKGEAVVFVGHGTAHPGNDSYPALNHRLQKRDPLVYLGVMSSGHGSDKNREPSVETIRNWLTDAGVTNAALLPFLFGAGLHVKNDLMGDSPESWEYELGQAGINCRGVLKGSGEYDQLADIWMAHLSDAMTRLGRR